MKTCITFVFLSSLFAVATSQYPSAGAVVEDVADGELHYDTADELLNGDDFFVVEYENFTETSGSEIDRNIVEADPLPVFEVDTPEAETTVTGMRTYTVPMSGSISLAASVGRGGSRHRYNGNTRKLRGQTA